MSNEQFHSLLAAMGAYSLGAVFLLSTLAAAIRYDSPIAVLLVIASAGVGYLSQVAAFLKYLTASQWGWFVSVLCGAFAFLFTMMGI